MPAIHSSVWEETGFLDHPILAVVVPEFPFMIGKATSRVVGYFCQNFEPFITNEKICQSTKSAISKMRVEIYKQYEDMDSEFQSLILCSKRIGNWTSIPYNKNIPSIWEKHMFTCSTGMIKASATRDSNQLEMQQ